MLCSKNAFALGVQQISADSTLEGMKSPVSARKVLSKIGDLCFCTSKENYVFAGHYCIADGRSRHPLHDLLVYETGQPLPFSTTATHVHKIV